MDITTEIKKEIITNVLYHKDDIFLKHGIILENFDFEIASRYEQLLKEPFLSSENLTAYLRIPLNLTSKKTFEFSVFLNLGFEPSISYYLYQSLFNIEKPEISLEISLSDPFVEENFKGNWRAFSEYARPILKEYFKEEEVDLILKVTGAIYIEIEPYIKYKEIII
jgi:hypothetical protein